MNSTELILPGEARALSMSIQADIPREWPEGPWVTAEIKPIYTTGEGEWTPVRPQGTSWQKDPAPETITLSSSTNKVKVRIIIQRPTDIQYQNETPIINSYVVKGLPR